jgi:hypothetical protein
MYYRLLAILGIGVLCAPLPAQEALPRFVPVVANQQDKTLPPIVQYESAPPVAIEMPIEYASPYTLRSWTRAEYLLWWVTDSPVPIPLVTSGNPADALPGALDQPGTRVLFGNSGVGYRGFSGLRITLGTWLDPEELFGIEGSGFLLERRSSRTYFTSNAVGSPVLAIPFFNQTPGTVREDREPISNVAAKLAGNVLVASSLQLWGAEANAICCLWREPNLEWNALLGFRYLDLHERMQILKHKIALATPPMPDTVFTTNDLFSTRNQFYGGQVGTRLSWQFGRCDLDLTAKVALGTTHQVVDIHGGSSQVGPAAVPPNASFPGGLFAQPTNIGRNSSNQFSVIPAVEFRLGYHISERCRAFVGYDCLYWNSVVRPGNQIDRNINQTQSVVLGGNGILNGPPVPVPLFNRSDFWAHGVNFGLEFRF